MYGGRRPSLTSCDRVIKRMNVEKPRPAVVLHPSNRAKTGELSASYTLIRGHLDFISQPGVGPVRATSWLEAYTRNKNRV